MEVMRQDGLSLTDLAHIHVSEENDAHWEKSVKTGDKIGEQPRTQHSSCLTGQTGILTFDKLV